MAQSIRVRVPALTPNNIMVMKSKYRGFKNFKRPILMFHKTYPQFSNADIARKLGCSREYVRQVLLDNDITRPRTSKENKCENCNKIIGRYSTLCRTCYEGEPLVEIQCSHCYNVFTKLKKLYTYQKKKGQTNFYCNLQCAGKGKKKINDSL